MSLYPVFNGFSRVAVLTITLFTFLSISVAAQKVDNSKLATGLTRASNATKALSAAAALPAGETIPKELLAKAKAIGVFPGITKINLLFRKALKGAGLVSRRTSDGWGTPVYYSFGSIDAGWTKIKTESPDVILLFMTDWVMKDLEKGGIELLAVAGPIGEITAEEEKKIDGARILLYAVGDGKMTSFSLRSADDLPSSLGPDNPINKVIYPGVKSQDLFIAKVPPPGPLAKEIEAFQTGLSTFSKP